MRFEMNADSVMALIDSVYVYMQGIDDDSNPSLYKSKLLSGAKLLIKKIKVYSQQAFLNREEYRKEMKSLEETWEEFNKKLTKKVE